MLDSDLAWLYGVTTSNLNLAVKRNRDRFPDDFMFMLTASEAQNLRLQFAISSEHGGRRRPAFVFTEQGVAMLSGILRSKRAVLVNIQIMRAFVRLREILASNKDLAARVVELEKKYGSHDEHIRAIFTALHELIEYRSKPKQRIGFRHG